MFHNFVTHSISHTACSRTTLSHATCSHTQSFNTNFVTNSLSHTTCSHTTLSHTTCSHTTLSHTTCSHTTLSHTIFQHKLCHTHKTFHKQLVTYFVNTHLCHIPSGGTLRGRRGTWRHPPSLCVAGVALAHIDLRFAWQAWLLWHWAGSGGALGRTTLSHTTLHIQLFKLSILHHLHCPFCFLRAASTTFSDYWKKLTCGIIRSFDFITKY